MDAKAQLRAQMKFRLKALPPDEHARASRAACERLLGTVHYAAARTLFGFVPFGCELDARPVLEAALRDGKALALPRSAEAENTLTFHRVRDLAAELTPGRFGILEPRASAEVVPVGDADAILVPGVAFTERGERLGQGGGFYDRLLSDVSLRGKTIALAFELQIVGVLPTQEHDARVARVITEETEYVGA